MASEIESQGNNTGAPSDRVDQRSAADLRRMEAHELGLAEQTDLPMVRAQHREAARRWGQMAAQRERVDDRARTRDNLLGGGSIAPQNG